MYIGHCVSIKSQALPNMQQAYSVPVEQVNQFGNMHGAQQSQSMNNMHVHQPPQQKPKSGKDAFIDGVKDVAVDVGKDLLVEVGKELVMGLFGFND